MTTYRLWPSTSGPASPVAYSGNFISGVNFAVTASGCWFEGYWWWVAAAGQSTSPVKCALWSVSQTAYSGSGNVLVPGSVVTSGTLTAGQWNYIPLSAPVQLSPGYVAGMTGGTAYGSGYCAAIGCNGAFPDSANWWGTNEPSGITNGPLFAYGTSGGSYPAPYSIPQGCFSTGGSDPSATMPVSASGTDNFWVDVQISNAAPSGYSGSYRIWPSKGDTNAETGSDSAVAYVIATEIDLSETCALDFIHYFVPNGMTVAAGLATQADVWNISTGLAVASLTSPAWTTEAGGTVTLSSTYGQWVKAAFPGGTTLPAGNYRVSVYNANGATGAWGAKDAATNYFSSGVGQSGLTWGPLTAPDQASAQSATYYPGTGTGSTGGQPVFAYSGTDTFPDYTTGTNPAQNYWVDLEVTPTGLSAAASLTVTPSFSAARTRGKYRAPGLTVPPSFSAARTRGKYRTGTLAVTPSFSAVAAGGGGGTAHTRTAALTVRPVFSAEPSGGTRPLPGGMFGVTGAYDPPRRRPWKGGSW